MWAVKAWIADKRRKVGIRCDKFWISIALVMYNPKEIPTMELTVPCEAALPWMSAMLLFFANLKLIEALDADESIQQIFLPTLAKEAINKKYYGKTKVEISTQKAMFSTATDINLHFLISVSKFFPNRPANKIAPNCPNPSFSTHVYAAAPTDAYVIVLPNDKNKHYVVKNPIVVVVVIPTAVIQLNFK